MPHHYSWRVGKEREDNDKICLHSNPLSLARSPSVSVIMLRLRVIVYGMSDGIDLPELTEYSLTRPFRHPSFSETPIYVITT